MGGKSYPGRGAKRTCEWCGKHFEVWPCVAKNGGGRFCSVGCSGKWRGTVKDRKKQIQLLLDDGLTDHGIVMQLPWNRSVTMRTIFNLKNDLPHPGIAAAKNATERLIRVVDELRLKKGYSMRDLGLLTGLTHTTISMIIKRRTDPQLSTVIKLAAVLGFSLDALMKD